MASAPLHLPDRLLHDPVPLLIAYTVLSIDPTRANRPDTLETRAGYAYACLPTRGGHPGELSAALLNVECVNVIIDTYNDVRRGRPAGLTPSSTTLIRERAARVRGTRSPHE